MSKKKVGRQLVTDIIKRVLANRDDIQSDDLFVRQVTSNAMRSTPVIDILSRMSDSEIRHLDNGDNEQLASCIEVLALINSMIDFQKDEKTHN
jgi:hypothetical protein